MEQLILNSPVGLILEFYFRMNIAILSRIAPVEEKRTINNRIESCMNDLEINVINKIKNGDINSFEQIVEKYKDKAYTLTLRNSEKQ